MESKISTNSILNVHNGSSIGNSDGDGDGAGEAFCVRVTFHMIFLLPVAYLASLT